MKKVTLIFALLLLTLLSVGCGKQDDGSNPEDTGAKVLIIGDSISEGYTGALLLQKASVVHNQNPSGDFLATNARASVFGIDMIDVWLDLAMEQHEIKYVTLNHGLWDISSDVFPRTSLVDYQANLEYEVGRIRARGLPVMFITSTYAPVNSARHPHVESYNAAAKEVMEALDVPVCDIYEYSKSIKHLQLNQASQADVHFTDEGSALLAEQVSNCLLQQGIKIK
jgi:lysophospholipase L1-like esterase